MLKKRGAKEILDITEYHNAFCFPIINFYKNIGFDFRLEKFEDVANEFIGLYHSEESIDYWKLHLNAINVLNYFQKINKIQVILSASQITNLLSQVEIFDVKQYFAEILGLENIYAKSKIDIGLKYILQNRVDNGILIGDTEHDYEVSKELNMDCLLIANGHQDVDKLLHCNVPVLNDISELKEFIQ